MTNKEIKYAMRLLNLMCDDLNDAHNNFDVDTQTENRYKQEMIDAVNNFNSSQTVWVAKFYKNEKGWMLRYE